MKLISIVIPTYNEEQNIMLVYQRVVEVMTEKLPNYDYEIMYADNCSTDHSKAIIEELCRKDSHVLAIFNAKNFGQMRSHYYALTQATGDCAILMHADMQNPPELIPEFVKYWDEGYKTIIGVKKASKENHIMFFLRSCYYKMMKKISDVEQIEHFTDFELLDREFLEVLKKIDDPMPYLRGIVSEFGFKMKKVYYVQNKREHGKSTANVKVLYDFGMLGITSYSKGIMRLATIIGFILSGVSFIIAILMIILKLLFWSSYPIGTASIVVGVFLLGAIQLFFIGFLGEYVVNINTRVMRRPLVIEEKRINFRENPQK